MLQPVFTDVMKMTILFDVWVESGIVWPSVIRTSLTRIRFWSRVVQCLLRGPFLLYSSLSLRPSSVFGGVRPVFSDTPTLPPTVPHPSPTLLPHNSLPLVIYCVSFPLGILRLSGTLCPTRVTFSSQTQDLGPFGKVSVHVAPYPKFMPGRCSLVMSMLIWHSGTSHIKLDRKGRAGSSRIVNRVGPW